MSISRRDFLKGAAASAAAMGLGNLGVTTGAKAEATAEPQVLTAENYQNIHDIAADDIADGDACIAF